jgi:hypothetical protein
MLLVLYVCYYIYANIYSRLPAARHRATSIHGSSAMYMLIYVVGYLQRGAGPGPGSRMGSLGIKATAPATHNCVSVCTFVPVSKHFCTSIARIRTHTHTPARWCQQGAPQCLHTSAYVSIRQHTSAYVNLQDVASKVLYNACIRLHTSAYVSIRQHTSTCKMVPARCSTMPAESLRTHIVVWGHI